MAIARLLRLYVKPEWRWTHFPAGEARDKRTAAKLKAMGLNAGWPDFILIGPGGHFHALECKSQSGSLSEAQREFHAWANEWFIPVIVIRNLDEATHTLKAWGALKHDLAVQ